MSTAASGLKDLHSLHIRLRDSQGQLKRGPMQVAARQQLIDRKQADLDAQKDLLLQLKKGADEKTLQLKTNEAKIADLNSKLNSASSNREFDIFKSQIDADTMANSVLEDEILEAMEKTDLVQTALEKLEAEYSAACKELQRVVEKVSAAEPQLQQEVSELESSLRIAEGSLPGEVAVVYRRLVQAHGADALAPVESKACTGCYSLLAPQESVQINVGKILFCRSCGRLLYLAESE